MLREHGYEVCFATETGQAAIADPIMLSGAGLGHLKSFLIAQNQHKQLTKPCYRTKPFKARYIMTISTLKILKPSFCRVLYRQ